MDNKYLNFRLIHALVLCCLIPSCIDDDFNNSEISDFQLILNSLYKNINESYVFWDVDSVNWEKRYQETSIKIRELNDQNEQDWNVFFGYIDSATHDLVDQHFRIDFEKGPLIGKSILRMPQNVNVQRLSFGTVKDYLFDSGYEFRYIENNVPISILYGQPNLNTLLFKINFFKLERGLLGDKGEELRTFLDKFFELYNQNEISTLILDLRGCSGGDLVDLNFFLKFIVKEKISLGFTRQKMGYGKIDYSSWLPAFYEGNVDLNSTKKIICLIDRSTASLGELLSGVLSSNGISFNVGEETFGALSPVSDSNIFGSGKLPLGGFGSLILSSVQYKLPNGKRFDGIGIPPDLFYSSDSNCGASDCVLEYALKLSI